MVKCDKPPTGWSCSRENGHEGPCAATPNLVKRYMHDKLHNRMSEDEGEGDWVLFEDVDPVLARMADRVQHTQEWYAARWARLDDWARKEIPDELSNQYFSIWANGTKDPYEPPTYAQQLNIQKYRAETATKEADKLRAALEESVKLQSHYAELLNAHDGGERRGFASADEWLKRLEETR